MKIKEINEAKQNAKTKLINLLQDTDTIYTVLHNVSKSGLSRVISFYMVNDNKEIININYYISVLLGYKFDKTHFGLKVKGCGMDMGFHVVDTLSRVLDTNGKISHRWL